MDGNNEVGTQVLKKKRGRPRKNDAILLPGEISALGVTSTSNLQSRNPRIANIDVLTRVLNRPLLGEPVNGVVDGSFDAGYLVTVRVGDSDTVLRGIVFGPGLSLPLSKSMDIAPKVKVAKKDAGMAASSLPTSLSPTLGVPSQVDYDRGMALVTPQNTSVVTASTIPQSSEQETRNFACQQDFLHGVARGFTVQGFSSFVQDPHFADPNFGSANSHFVAGTRGGPQIS